MTGQSSQHRYTGLTGPKRNEVSSRAAASGRSDAAGRAAVVTRRGREGLVGRLPRSSSRALGRPALRPAPSTRRN